MSNYSLTLSKKKIEAVTFLQCHIVDLNDSNDI